MSFYPFKENENEETKPNAEVSTITPEAASIGAKIWMASTGVEHRSQDLDSEHRRRSMTSSPHRQALVNVSKPSVWN